MYPAVHAALHSSIGPINIQKSCSPTDKQTNHLSHTLFNKVVAEVIVKKLKKRLARIGNCFCWLC